MHGVIYFRRLYSLVHIVECQLSSKEKKKELLMFKKKSYHLSYYKICEKKGNTNQQPILER